MKSKMRRGPFLLNLPFEIMVHVFSRLPVQTIIRCRCVCKKLLELLSTPEFVASHLELSTPGLLVHQHSKTGNLLQIFQFEDGFELQKNNINHNLVMNFDPDVCIGLSDGYLQVVGSVNGLLCLRDYNSELYEALYICNPITREYIALPRIEGSITYSDFQYGFGVSKISGEYKVVRNVHRHPDDHEEVSCCDSENYECMVYTVGTSSWRNIQPGEPFGHFDLPVSSFLNGNLHGSVHDFCGSGDILISCFDLEAESFLPFPPPPPPPNSPGLGTLGLLDDYLCFVDNCSKDTGAVDVWVMKEYGVENSWTKQLVIAGVARFVCTSYDPVFLIKAFQNGDILLSWFNSNLFYFNNKTRTCQKLDLVIQNKRSWVNALTHSSSFLSLKSLEGENVLSFSH